ncbi:MAG: hypothetical protein DI606_04425 [Sphingobium sp.]|uniref:hypothetical protein n=1 Tax=Sphingobium sp. TaxID=1912891 RepID=UPI000DB77300|nr:hypothetical protein [Sphingobium sp.]PZU13817.1 MAG: hypothetical protein DI606_04425 [Sphingobium sp.]
MDDANALRGEVDLILEGQTYVLRPSHQAIIAMEKKTGRSLIELASLAEQSMLDQATQAIVVTELIRAWGRSIQIDEYASGAEKAVATAAKGANVDIIGELLYSVGVLSVQPRVAIVLGLALTGGCLPSGEMKATGTTTSEIPAAD